MTKQVDVISASRSSMPPPRRSSAPRCPRPRRIGAPGVALDAPVASVLGRRDAVRPRLASTAVLRASSSPESSIVTSAGEPCEPAAPGLAPELSERWTAIVDRARTIDRARLFRMLDLARDSTMDEAQSSFLALAMKWHPDRLPPELFPCARHVRTSSRAWARRTRR